MDPAKSVLLDSLATEREQVHCGQRFSIDASRRRADWHQRRCVLRSLWRLKTLAALLLTAMASNPFQAGAQNIVRIEEDWELQVSQPDAQIDAPQITTTMAPFGDASETIFQVDLNHASWPNFASGGVQVRICDDTTCSSQKRFLDDIRLSHASETVQWTQVIQKVTNGFYFGLKNGNGDTFGDFGGDTSFVFISNADTGASSLELYRHEDSLSNSGVTFAGNRVGWLRLKKLRLYNSANQVTEWTLNADAK